MICLTCRTAADAQAPADQHCNTTGGPGAHCTCQHRTDRYQPAPEDGPTAFEALWEQHLGTIYRTMMQATYLPPAACRCGGQNFAGQILHRYWCPWKNDPAPLREVAMQALTAQPSTIREAWRRYEMRGYKIPLRHLNAPLHPDTTED